MARALFLSRGGAAPAMVLTGWLEAGNSVAEIWSQRGERDTEPLLRCFAPAWDAASVAARAGIAWREVPRLRGWTDAAARIAAIGADTLITATTMQIVPSAILDLFGGRAVNFHPALLPHYRGPSPVVGMLLDGAEDRCGGMSLHVLSPGIDEGPIIGQRAIPYSDVGRSMARWEVAHALAARDLARDDLAAYLDGSRQPVAQGPGSYRRLGDETVLGPHLSLAEAGQALDLAGRLGRVVAIGAAGRRHRATRLVEVVGPPSGAPLELGPLAMSLDIADARVRVARRNVIDRLAPSFALLAAIRAAGRARHQE